MLLVHQIFHMTRGQVKRYHVGNTHVSNINKGFCKVTVPVDYDNSGLREWSRVVLEVNTSWRRITDFLDDEYFGSSLLLKDDYRTIAYMIVSRWLFPKNNVRSTSLSDLKKIYMPMGRSAELLGNYEYAADKSAYDKVRGFLKELEDADLITRKKIHREVHFEPTHRLMEYCVDCRNNLMEILENAKA